MRTIKQVDKLNRAASRRNLSLTFKNSRTGLAETIEQADYSFSLDSQSFTVASEMEAYKAAYLHRNSGVCTVKYCPRIDRWLVEIRDA